MKKRNSGFIATSLLYSFFLVFIALLANLFVAYISNKIILIRFNEHAMDELNGNSYTIKLISKASEIQNGYFISNMIKSGNFSDVHDWYYTGSLNISANTFKKNNADELSQILNLIDNHKYYFSLEYSYSSNSNLPSTYIKSLSNPDSSQIIVHNNTSGSFIRKSAIFTNRSSISGDNRIYIGYNSNNGTQGSYKNVMVIDLTAYFGAENEPSKEWMDSNIDFFDGLISYITINNVHNYDELDVKIDSYGKSNYSLDCKTFTLTPSNNGSSSLQAVMKAPASLTPVDGIYPFYTLTFRKITSDLTCDIKWS